MTSYCKETRKDFKICYKVNDQENNHYIKKQPALAILLWWRFGAVGSDVGQINEVTLRRARLVLGRVTVSGFKSRCGKFISV